MMKIGTERKEQVRSVAGYRGRYLVGDLGRVYSRGCELSLIDGKYVNLCKDGVAERRDVAYLVARAFLPNPKARPYVRHKDGDVRNNRVENLEWSEVKDQRRCVRKAESKRVIQYDLSGACVGVYESVGEAEEKTGVSRALIRRNAKGESRRAKKWIFRYL